MVINAFDTHVHLDMYKNVNKELEEALNAGVANWVIPGVRSENWQKLSHLAKSRTGVFYAPGIHPEAAGSFVESDLVRLGQMLAQPDAIAIGEVGLDRSVAVPLEIQERVFVKMIHLALEMGKPLLIHQRQCFEQTLALLKREKAHDVGGIFHAFSGSLESAKEIVDAGFALGVGGVVTWLNARRLPKVVAHMPASSLVLESDAPFISPEPYRHESNRPAYLMAVAEKVAQLRGWTLQETVQITTTNARRIFKL